jgi:spermidine synthase
LQVLEADGADYLAGAEKGIDVLLLDAFDRRGYAPSLAGADFFVQAKAKLGGGGVLVANLAGDPAVYAGVIGTVMEVFGGQTILVPVREDDNQLLLAFKDPSFEPDWRRLRNQAKELRAKYDLDFPDFLQKIAGAAKMGLARREAERGR